MRILAMDIGANNVKAVSLATDGTEFALGSVQTRCHEADALPDDIEYCSQYLADQRPWDAVCLVNSITGYFPTHRIGLERLNRLLTRAFASEPVYHLTAGGELVSVADSPAHVIYEFMGTNFYGSAALGAKATEAGIVVDVGTSSTDIIPVAGGRPRPLAAGRADYNRFVTSELHMWGLLYTPVELLCPRVMFRGALSGIVPGVAKTGHTHALLGYVDAEVLRKDFQTTWSFKDAHERMAHMMCLDPELVTDDEIMAISQYVHEQQIDQTAAAIERVARQAGVDLSRQPVVAMGLAKDVIVAPAARRVGARVLDPTESLPKVRRNVVSAVGTAVAAYEQLTGQRLTLEQLSRSAAAAGAAVQP